MRTIHSAIAVGAALLAVGCHRASPVAAVAPEVRPTVDEAALRARQDSIDAANRAREEEARRLAQERAAAAARAADQMRAELEARIHFAFDKSTIRPEDAELLDQKIRILRANSNVHIRIAGNCDERGSDEYNLALGNRRAIAAKQYLVNHGVDGSRIDLVSYGKERPVDPDHNEKAWALNRRDEFDILTPSVVLRQP